MKKIGEKGSGAIAVLALVAIAGFTWFEVRKSKEASRHKLKAAAEISKLSEELDRTEATVVGFTDPVSARFREALALRTHNLILKTIRSPSDLQADPPLVDQLRAAGRMTDTSLKLPAVFLGGRILSDEEMALVTTEVPAKYLEREKIDPYILVYGPQNCAFTARMKEALAAQGLPFEFRDLNANAEIAGRAEARVMAAGFKGELLEFPLVEVGTWIKSRPKFEDVAARFELDRKQAQ